MRCAHRPGVCKAVKWNSPLYGVQGQGRFLGIHCFTGVMRYVRGVSGPSIRSSLAVVINNLLATR